MKSSLFAIILGFFMIPCSAQIPGAAVRNNLDGQTQISPTDLANQQESPILSKDYRIAKQSLDKAIYERDEATLRIGLNADLVVIRQGVYRAVSNLYYQWFVPDLIQALEENQSATDKDDKTESERKKLNKSIIGALQNLTGLGFFANEKILPAGEFQEIRDKSSEWYRTYEKQIEQAKREERFMLRQEISILSKYHYLAERAFDKAVSEKDKATLRLGLQTVSLPLKSKIVNEIKQFDDQSFVPDLIAALETNQGLMSGGSETRFMQEQLNREIVFALEKLTGLEFPYFEDSPQGNDGFKFPRKDIERILKETRNWCETQQIKCRL